jgi:ubiquitin-like protein Pup
MVREPYPGAARGTSRPAGRPKAARHHPSSCHAELPVSEHHVAPASCRPFSKSKERAMRHQVERRTHHRDRESDEVAAGTTEHAPAAEELKHDLDEILDEIDELLEQNAEEFVKAYVQKGGE